MSDKKKLSGDSLNIVELNYLLYGCADPDYPNTKYMDAPEMEFFKAKLNLDKKITGKIIITSTPADDGGSNEFYKQNWENKI